MKTELKAGDIAQAIHLRHAPPEWATFSELRNATGYGHSRTIDVAAFNTWKSSGHLRVAYEVKVFRSDFLKELDKPAKHAWVEEAFHETYFAAPSGLIKKTEVPEGWGLLEVRRTKAGELACRRVVRARRRDVGDLPQPVMLSVLRRASEQVSQARNRVYKVDGEELDADGLRKLVDGRVAESLAFEQEALARLKKKAEEKYHQADLFVAPLKRLVGHAAYHGCGVPESMSADDVDQMLERAVAKRLQQCTGAVQAAHDQLGMVMAKLAEDGVEGAGGTG